MGLSGYNIIDPKSRWDVVGLNLSQQSVVQVAKKVKQKTPATPAQLPNDWFGPHAAEVAATDAAAGVQATAQQITIDTQTIVKYAVWGLTAIGVVYFGVKAVRSG